MDVSRRRHVALQTSASRANHTSARACITARSAAIGMSAGDAEKAKGNAEFSAGNYDQAIVHFSAAIGLGATHVLYSNRSACYCGLRKYDEALEDVRAGRTSPARSTANAAHPPPRARVTPGPRSRSRAWRW